MEVNLVNTTILLLINIVVLMYSRWINKKIFRTYKYVSLTFIFSLLFFFFYMIVHAYIIYSGETRHYYENTQNLFYPLFAAILATLCNIFYNIGVTCFACKKKILPLGKLPIKIYSPEKLLRIGLIVFGIGALAKISTWLYLGHGNILSYLTSYYQIQLTNATDGSGIGKYFGFFYAFIEIGAYILYAYYQITKKKRNLISFTTILSFVLHFNSRGAIIRMLIGYMIITAIYKPNFRQNIKKYILLLILPLIVIVALGLGALRDSTKGTMWQDVNPAYMIFGVNHAMRGLSDELEYSNKFTTQWGKSIILPIIQKPIPRKYWANKQMSSSMIYTDKTYPGIVEAGGGIAAGLCADLYLNFGILGMLLSFFIIGYVTAVITYSLLKKIIQNNLNVFYLIIYTTLAEFTFLLRGEDISLFFYFYSIIFIPLCLLFLNIKIRIR